MKYLWKKIKISFSKEHAFTLLESLIAIAIFTTGVSASMFVITQSISVGARTKHKIVAAHLAQEGIEVLHNIRDRNWADGNAWNDGMIACGSFPCSALVNGCVQWDSDVVDAGCILGPNIIFNGTYYVLTGASTQFARTIDIELFDENGDGKGDHMVATSTVVCGQNCSISLAEDLFDWK